MKLVTPMLLAMLLVLPGCLDNRPQQNAQAPTITNQPRPGGSTKEDLEATAEDLKKEINTSQNAIQTNMQALVGANIGKVAEKLVDLKDLLHAEIGDIQNQMSASVASNNELRAMLKVQMDLNANLQATLTASINTNAQLQAMLDAKVQAIAAGIAGKIETTTNDLKQNLQAGHDVNNVTQNFTKETLEAVKSANRTNAWNTSGALFVVLSVMLALIIGAAIVICVVFNNQRKDAQGEVKTKQIQLERALAILPPHEVERMFPKSGSGDAGSPP